MPEQSRAPSWSVVRRVARERFEVESFRRGQRALVAAALEGRDAVGILPTGAGKSLCFQLPSLFLPGITVVVSPLLALMQDQKEKLDQADVPAAKLDSTLTASEERETEAGIRRREAEIVYVTPERLERPDVIDMLRKRGVSLFVVDEAHCVSQWGHDFRPAFLSLRDAIAALGRPAVMALTATATPEVEADIVQQLRMRDPEIVRTDIGRKNLFFEVRRTPSEDAKRAALPALVREANGSAIVYAATVKTVDELLPFLRGHGVRAEKYHAKMSTRERERSQAAFMSGEVDVIVATTAFGLGIDKPDVRMVVHYNFPDSLESYYQQAGRAGRDGEPARAVLLYRLEDRRVQAYFLGGKYPHEDELLRVYEAVRTEGGRTGAIRSIARACALPEKRVKVAIAQLESMGIVERRPKTARLLRTFESPAELRAYVTSYEARYASDHDRLDAVMRYAQSTSCRGRALAEYFGEEPDAEGCGHCDNCRDQPAITAATPEPGPEAAIAEPPPKPFEAGDTVKHRTFGRGSVVDVTSEHVRVRFDEHGEKAVAPAYLRSA